MTGAGHRTAATGMRTPAARHRGPGVVPPHGLAADSGDAGHDGAPAAPTSVPPRFAGRVSRVLIPARALQRRITDMARDLASHHPPDGELVITPVLNGAFMFAADLARALGAVSTLDVRFEFAKTSTYGDAVSAGGDERRVQIDLQPADVVGRSMLLVDDILDHGFTLCALRDRMAGWGVRNVQVCVLLDKQLAAPSPETLAQRAKAAPDLIGFQIPDVWVAGYGLDAAGALRQLPDIVAVDADT